MSGLSHPPAQDTLTFLRAANELWGRKQAGRPLKIGVVFGDLCGGQNTPGWLFESDGQQHEPGPGDGSNQPAVRADAVYFGGMYDMQDRARPASLSRRFPTWPFRAEPKRFCRG